MPGAAEDNQSQRLGRSPVPLRGITPRGSDDRQKAASLAPSPAPASRPGWRRRLTTLLFRLFVLAPLIWLKRLFDAYSARTTKRRQEKRFITLLGATEDPQQWKSTAVLLDNLRGFQEWRANDFATEVGWGSAKPPPGSDHPGLGASPTRAPPPPTAPTVVKKNATGDFNVEGLRSDINVMQELLAVGNKRAMGEFIRTGLHRKMHGVTSPSLYRYYSGTKDVVELYFSSVCRLIETFCDSDDDDDDDGEGNGGGVFKAEEVAASGDDVGPRPASGRTVGAPGRDGGESPTSAVSEDHHHAVGSAPPSQGGRWSVAVPSSTFRRPYHPSLSSSQPPATTALASIVPLEPATLAPSLHPPGPTPGSSASSTASPFMASGSNWVSPFAGFSDAAEERSPSLGASITADNNDSMSLSFRSLRARRTSARRRSLSVANSSVLAQPNPHAVPDLGIASPVIRSPTRADHDGEVASGRGGDSSRSSSQQPTASRGSSYGNLFGTPREEEDTTETSKRDKKPAPEPSLYHVSPHIRHLLHWARETAKDKRVARVPLFERYTVLKETAQSFGRTALLLSGGASLGVYHTGVVKALWNARLLPRIITGSSAGAIIASIFCTRTDDEVETLVNDPDIFSTISLEAFERHDDDETSISVKTERLLSSGAFMDVTTLMECLRKNTGDMTFLEAYEKTHRILNVSVAADRREGENKSLLLNYVTAPNVIIWSAVAASCAMPGLFSAVQLLQKHPKSGKISAYLEGQLWYDGSVCADLPAERVAQMFNVGFCIVSQVNPHVIPFYRPEPSPIVHKNRPSLASRLWFAGWEEFRYWLLKCFRFGVFPTSGGWEVPYRMTKQNYMGDITLFPIGSVWQAIPDFINLTTNPSKEHLEYVVAKGQRRSWPFLNRIRCATVIERRLERHLEAIVKALPESF